MGAQALLVEAGQQLGLYDKGRADRPVPVRVAPRRVAPQSGKPCAGCRSREARYGFRDQEGLSRPRTLCFECFRMEIDRRQRVAAQLARGWNAEQVSLPLADTLRELDLRRRRAQIAARKALASDPAACA